MVYGNHTKPIFINARLCFQSPLSRMVQPCINNWKIDSFNKTTCRQALPVGKIGRILCNIFPAAPIHPAHRKVCTRAEIRKFRAGIGRTCVPKQNTASKILCAKQLRRVKMRRIKRVSALLSSCLLSLQADGAVFPFKGTHYPVATTVLYHPFFRLWSAAFANLPVKSAEFAAFSAESPIFSLLYCGSPPFTIK